MPTRTALNHTDIAGLGHDAASCRWSALDHIPLPVSTSWPKKRPPQTSPIGNGDSDKAGTLSEGSTSPVQKKARPVVPALRRPGTFRRQLSEHRDRLVPLEQCRQERPLKGTRPRAFSAARPAPPRAIVPRRSAPTIQVANRDTSSNAASLADRYREAPIAEEGERPGRGDCDNHALPDSPRSLHLSESDSDSLGSGSVTGAVGLEDPEFRKELEARWILNLSLAFRDKSDREKFFVTYAEEPNRWRRVTCSCDYRDAPEDSLEADLKSLRYQRDKSAHIYEAIRDSLPTVQFYDTVTNLKLETADSRLHVHVTEDVNEIISYPPVTSVQHLQLSEREQITEDSLHFVSHISGFVYQIEAGGQSYIKKEIPGPDMVDEFLYEVNALYKLRHSKNVIRFQALVLDESRSTIKGLLISFAPGGALVDLIYDHITSPLSWPRRNKWVRQIVSGLADIHEAGFVQGDFTLSNIVIDDNDDAKIIDINRRGCPVGWEPPEFLGLITSGQRISMYIGTKSDLFQLGMVLWALSVPNDEPERAETPLSMEEAKAGGAPEYLIRWITKCLSEDPSKRVSAKELLIDLNTPKTAANGSTRTAMNGLASFRERSAPNGRTSAFLKHPDSDDRVLATTNDAANPHSLSSPNLRNGNVQSRDAPGEGPEMGPPLHERHSISGRRAVEEPESFNLPIHAGPMDHGRGMPPPGRDFAPWSTPRYNFNPPLHQDSGFGPEHDPDYNVLTSMLPPATGPKHGAAKHDSPHGRPHNRNTSPHFSPPIHQDSGFVDGTFGKPPARRNRDVKATPSMMTDEFAGIGAAHAESNEDRGIYVA